MTEFLTLEAIDHVAVQVKLKTKHNPKIGLILGSGLGGLADAVSDADKIPYPELDGWPISTVHGHSGQLVIGELEGKSVLVMQGRAHFYEGYSISQIGLPIRVMKRLGIETVIITNAAGAVNPDYEPGDLIHTFGDAHIYSNHMDQIRLQLSREPRPLPRMILNPEVKNIFEFKYKDFNLVDYNPHPHIKGAVSV